MEFGWRVPGPSHEVSSQGVVTRDMLCSICRIDGPSMPHDGSVWEELFLNYTLNYYRMIDTISTLSLNHKQSFLESFDQKTLKSQCLNSWPGSLFATTTHWNTLVLHLSAFIAVFVWQDFQTNDCFLTVTTTLLCYCQKIQTLINVLKLTSPMLNIALWTSPGYRVPKATYSGRSKTLQLIVKINVLS